MSEVGLFWVMASPRCGQESGLVGEEQRQWKSTETEVKGPESSSVRWMGTT